MKAKNLIKRLQACDPEKDVAYDDNEHGPLTVSDVIDDDHVIHLVSWE